MTDLSVVIASHGVAGALADCLSSLKRQNPDGGVEIIVAADSTGRSVNIVEEQFPGVRLVNGLGPALVPELWARGAEAAQGRTIAFTTADFVPAPDWIVQIRRHHALGYEAVGGAIENGASSSAVQWAVYFCRYAAYMPPFPPRAAVQIAGDNASYRRAALERCADLTAQGFWEYTVNERLHRDGHALLLTPALRVTHACAPSAWQFCRQRFAHGRVFGVWRASVASTARRAVYLAASPAIPFAVLAKITSRVVANGRHVGSFVRALPLVVLFTLAWAGGEALGYLYGSLRRAGPSAIASRAAQ